MFVLVSDLETQILTVGIKLSKKKIRQIRVEEADASSRIVCVSLGSIEILLIAWVQSLHSN